jgi:quercetin dioxygenase-like cupin family protein
MNRPKDGGEVEPAGAANPASPAVGEDTPPPGEAPGGDGEAGLIARVRERVLKAIRAEAAPRHHTVRAGHGAWEQVSPGVERKVLWDSGQARSWMVRLAPGAVVAAHAHPMDEECVVMQGSLRIGDLLLEAGDFHVGRQGSEHALTSSEQGALVYLRGAAGDNAG